MTNDRKYQSSGHWNGKNYRHVSSPQYSINMEFLNNIKFNGDESILDIGCGNGDTSREIAKRVSDGMVLGIDASNSMIDEAVDTQLQSNLSFKLINVADMNFVEQFDIVTTFFCMQWVADKKLVFRKIFNSLKDGGKFFMIVPMPHSHLPRIRQRLVESSRWREYFSSYQDPLIYINDNSYDLYAQQAGFQINKYEVELSPVCFSTYDSFFKFMYEMTPHLKQLPSEDLKNDFMRELLEEYSLVEPYNPQLGYQLVFNLCKMACSRL